METPGKTNRNGVMIMKISRNEFGNAILESVQHASNYEANLSHNAGRWNYHQIDKCMIDGVMYYSSSCCPNAYDKIGTVRRVISLMYGNN